jgi:hypothetical protein
MWSIWIKRNGWSFEDGERTVLELKSFFPYPFSMDSCL